MEIKVRPRLRGLMVAVSVLLLSLAAFATVAAPEADASDEGSSPGVSVEQPGEVIGHTEEPPDEEAGSESSVNSGPGLVGWLILGAVSVIIPGALGLYITSRHLRDQALIALALAAIIGVVGSGAPRKRARRT